MYNNFKIYFRIGNAKDYKEEIAAAVDMEDIVKACEALMNIEFCYQNIPSVPATTDVLSTALFAWRDSWRATTWSIQPDER